MTSEAVILIVDDDAANRRLLLDLVTRIGCVGVCASGGREALEILSKQQVDLVLLDWMMPDVDGMAVLAELQRRGMTPALPVVVVTALEDRNTRVDALSAGATDFLSKPIDRLELTCRIRTLVELKQLRERAVAMLRNRLRESDHLSRLRFEQATVAKIDWDTDMRVSNWNPAAERLFGYAQNEALGKHVSFLVAPEQRADATQIWLDISQGNAREATGENRTKDGRTIVCEWHSAPLRSSSGELLGASSVIIDVTERKQLQTALIQSQKMDAIGKLAGGIAHDFNNILAVIMSYATFVRDALPESDRRREDVVEVLKAADRALELTKQLLTFSRQQPTAKKHTNLNDSLSQLHRLLTRAVGSHIALSITPSVRTPVVYIDPVQFDQVVLNLVVNARDAMPQGGKLNITLEHPPELAATSHSPSRVRLTVSDTGLGMDEQTQQRIFEPFFTTKAAGKGTGLGLATCFGIVEEARGTIRVQSVENQGTTFIVELPLSNESAETQALVREVPRTGHGELVLVAEDEVALRRVAVRVLESAGYTVHTAVDGLDAIRKLDELGPRLGLLLSDLVMPGRSGHEVVAHAAAVAPNAAVVLTSGHHEDLPQNSKQKILWKPVQPRDLVNAVAEALAAKGSFDAAAREAEVRQSIEPAPPSTMTPVGASGEAAHITKTQSVIPPRAERVLVVDDNEAFALATARTLEGAEFVVTVAATLAAAREALSKGIIFDVLILDVALPDGSGFDLLANLTGDNADLPVIMVTGAPSIASASQAIRRRVTEYLPKPFAAEELVRIVCAAAEAGRISRLRTKLLAARFGGDEFVGNLQATEKSFNSALKKIRMVYQPIVRSWDGTIFGYEALLRCDEPTLNNPPRLLAAAEVLGRVIDVGHAVRAAVANTMIEHRDKLEAIFVNLHPSEFRADLLCDLSDPLIPMARRVVLEVTERAHLQGGAKLDAELVRIRELGYRLAVDDLGEGYAGLSSLVHLRPDIAKIDMSLVRDIHRAPLKRDIVAALVDMARRSGIVVVAEGIETVDERDTLADLGCDLFQGYLFAKPGAPFPTVRTNF